MSENTDTPAGPPPSEAPGPAAADFRGNWQDTVNGVYQRLSVAVETRPLLSRWILAGPGTIVVALLFTMAMPFWLPSGTAGVNHVALPVILAPLVWAVFFVYAVAAENIARAATAIAGISAITGLLILAALAG